MTKRDYERYSKNDENLLFQGRFLTRIEPNGDFIVSELKCLDRGIDCFWGFLLTKKYLRNGKLARRGGGVTYTRNRPEYWEAFGECSKQHELLIDKLELDAPDWYAIEFKKLFKNCLKRGEAK